MSTSPTADEEVKDHVSSAFPPENVAFNGSQDEVEKIVDAGPWGAVALAGLAVVVVLAIWVAFFIFVFLPRGAMRLGVPTMPPVNEVERSEHRWAYVVAGIIAFVFIVIIYSGVHWAAQPPSNCGNH